MELKAEKGKYRKKPVVVDAAEWLCKGHCPVWAQHAVREANTFFEVATLEGVMRGEPGDWIIRGVKGEIYLCKPDIFAATYEPALPHQATAEAVWLTEQDIRETAVDTVGVDYDGIAYEHINFARAIERKVLSRAAPTDQAVGHVFTMAMVPGEPPTYHAKLYVELPAGTRLFAAPQPSAQQPAAQAAGLTDEGIIDIAELDGVATYETGWYRMTRSGLLAFARALLSRAEREAAGLRQMLDAERQRASNAVAVSNALQDKLSRAAPQSSEQQADPCPGCIPGGFCKTPTCGRLQAREAERSRGKSVSQLVAECEADPHRKAALDRARERVAEQSPIHPEHMALLQSIASRLDGRLPRDVVGYIKKRYGTERADRDEIQALIDAAVNLVKVSGRYHSEIAYRRLATAANEYAAACREQMERANGR